jgi:hypothetical protein
VENGDENINYIIKLFKGKFVSKSSGPPPGEKNPVCSNILKYPIQ